MPYKTLLKERLVIEMKPIYFIGFITVKINGKMILEWIPIFFNITYSREILA